jgi:hypothetical protein
MSRDRFLEIGPLIGPCNEIAIRCSLGPAVPKTAQKEKADANFEWTSSEQEACMVASPGALRASLSSAGVAR